MEWRMVFLLFSGFIKEYGSVPHSFYFVNMNKTWTEAQSYCREIYTDLATTENMEDMEMMVASANGYDGNAWIGLYQTTDPSWKWTLADVSFHGPGESDFTAWNGGEPNGGDEEECAELGSKGFWNDRNCSQARPFVCYDGTRSGKKSYVLINEEKSWKKARKYCRDKHTDLVSVRNEQENNAINKSAGGKSVWIGLFRDNWMWSDRRNSSFTHWKPDFPDNKNTDNCAITVYRNKGLWEDRKCYRNHPFFCRLDKMHLVAKNLSWMDALNYCRENHMDLVSVTSAEIQGWVMEEAKKASTEHVWLGLRFLCALDIWFWVSGETVCYPNWAEGNRRENGREACTVDGDESAGAVQSGGNQQWVSLHESTKLNFICAAEEAKNMDPKGADYHR